jgi:hypothetical protein
MSCDTKSSRSGDSEVLMVVCEIQNAFVGFEILNSAICHIIQMFDIGIILMHKSSDDILSGVDEFNIMDKTVAK